MMGYCHNLLCEDSECVSGPDQVPDTTCEECNRDKPTSPWDERLTHEDVEQAKPVIELGTDYTRVKPAIKNIAESLLNAKEAPEAPVESAYYITTRYETHTTADIVSGLGMGLHVRVPREFRTPESELRFRIMGTLKSKDARERARDVKLFCIEERNA